MARLREAVQVRVAQAGGEVVGEVVVEHRVGRAPHHQARHVELAQRRGHCGDGCRRGVVVGEGHVVDEVGDRVAQCCSAIGGAQRVAAGGVELAQRQCPGAVDEHPRAPADEVGDRTAGCHPDQPRCLPPGGHGDAGVAQGEADQASGRSRRDGPALGHGTAPVVAHHDDRALDGQRVDDVAEVGHTRGVAAVAEAFGVAHAELVDSDHPMPGVEPGEHLAPQVAPGGVAVHAHDGRPRGLTCRGRGGSVEHMPAMCAAVVARDVDQARPGRVDAPSPELLGGGQLGRHDAARAHHTSSVKLVLRPEPMPMQSTRSPGFRSASTLASVIGIAAGPTLP